jgi:hypothetical protein
MNEPLVTIILMVSSTCIGGSQWTNLSPYRVFVRVCVGYG